MKKEQTTKLDISGQIQGVVGDYLNKFFDYKCSYPFPKIIRNYRFIKIFQDNKGNIYPNLGIYKNSKGQLAFAKAWRGRFYDNFYFSLKNEINLICLLNKVSKRISTELSPELKNIRIPKIVYKRENSHKLLFLIEYIKGVEIDALPEERRVLVYSNAVAYLEILGKSMTKDEQSLVSTRKVLDLLFLFPFVFIKAIYNHPKSILAFIRGGLIFIIALPLLFKNEYKLLHRDLHFKNILLDKKLVYIIDFQFSAFAPSIYEEITTLRYEWNNKKMVSLLINYIYQKYRNQKDYKRIFQALAVNSAIHSLTADNFPEETIDKFFRFFNFALDGTYLKRKGKWI